MKDETHSTRGDLRVSTNSCDKICKDQFDKCALLPVTWPTSTLQKFFPPRVAMTRRFDATLYNLIPTSIVESLLHVTHKLSPSVNDPNVIPHIPKCVRSALGLAKDTSKSTLTSHLSNFSSGHVHLSFQSLLCPTNSILFK